jgi:hypothetical protein
MQGPPQPYQPAPPPLPADDRIKKAVRRGEVFNEPYDAARAVAYAEGFLKNERDLTRPPVLLGITIGLLFLVVLEVTVGYVFLLVIPVGLFVGVIVYLAWLKANRPRVEQALEANRRVAGG